MIWWVLTYLDNYRPPHALGVLAETNLQAHLFMKWAKHKPSRRAVYKRVRGVNVWCGYEYIWDTPNLVEQSQPGNTFEHLFGLIPLAPTDHVWYYLFSIGERPFKECQSALFYVPPPELPMPAARIFHSINQAIPPLISTVLQFDSVAYDSYYFYDPAQPDRFTIPAGALYAFGACLRFTAAIAPACSIEICLNAGPPVIRHDHAIDALGWPGATLSVETQLAVRPGDFLQVYVAYSGPPARQVLAAPNYSPHFWIAQIGPYPISPP